MLAQKAAAAEKAKRPAQLEIVLGPLATVSARNQMLGKSLLERIVVDKDKLVVRVVGRDAESVDAARKQLEYAVAEVPVERERFGFVVGKAGANIKDLLARMASTVRLAPLDHKDPLARMELKDHKAIPDLKTLRQAVGEQNYDAWIEPLSVIESTEERITFRAPNRGRERSMWRAPPGPSRLSMSAIESTGSCASKRVASMRDGKIIADERKSERQHALADRFFEAGGGTKLE